MQPENQTPLNPSVTSSPAPQPQKRRQITLPNLWQLITLILIVVVIVMLFMWRPWQPNIKASERTISVTGDATVSATPDQYEFSPDYRFVATDKQTALNQLTAKSSDIVSHLKSLGVADKDIKTDSNGYGNGSYYPSSVMNGKTTYDLELTVTVNDSKVAQKVQDYLLTTSPEGEVTPYVSFSTAKQKQLQNQARAKAEQEARAQADQSAKNLGFKVDHVKSVQDGNLGGMNPYYGGLAVGANSASDTKSSPHLDLQPGQNDLSYSVQVVYYIH
jgi:uncharacterized protein YggE